MRGTKLLASYAVAISICVFSGQLEASVKFPNGEYQVTVEDLSVKVIGGKIAVQRTWMATDQNHGAWQWLFTPAWSDLQFTTDVIDGSVTSIQRGESTFTKSGAALFVYGATSEKRTFLKQQADQGWRWYDTLGNWMTYDTDGKLQSYGDRNVTIAYFVRDGGRISKILDNHNDAAHPVLSYEYTGDQLTGISDYSGRSVHYHYTGNQLTSVTDVLNNDWQYNYTGGLLTSWSDPEHGPDVKTAITYSGNRVVAVQDPMGFITRYEYSYDRGKQIYKIIEKDPPPSADQQTGVRTESWYDANAKLIYKMIGSRAVYRVKKDGATDVEIDERGLQTRTTYDSQHNPVKVVYPDGTSITRTYDALYSNVASYTDELGIRTTFAYDTHGNLITKAEAVEKPEQRVATYTYDDTGQLLTQTIKGMALPQGGDPNDAQYQDATTTRTYDQYGNVSTAADPMDHTTQFTAYNAMGDVRTKVDARGKTWTYTYNNRGQLASQTDPLSHTVKYGYDKIGNRVTVVDALNHLKTSAFDFNNRLTSVTDPTEENGTPGGVSTRSYFNDGRLKQACDQENACTIYAYDSYGRLVSTTDGSGNAVSLLYGENGTDQAGLVESTQYPTYSMTYRHDVRGRRIETVRNLPGLNGQPSQNQTTTLAYDGKGQLVSTTDALGRSTLMRYDALGRETQTTDALNGVTAYTYGNSRSPLTIIDAKKQIYRFSYDLSGYKVSESTPMGETTHFSYDDNGNLIAQTSATGDRDIIEYDDVGRRIGEKLYSSSDSTATQTISFAYDDRDFLTGYTQTGDTISTGSYAFDAKGRKFKETTTYGASTSAFSKTIETDFYANGKKRFFTYSDQTVIAYGYDASNILASATAPDGNTIQFTGVTWKLPTQVQYPGVVRNTTYDALLRPIEIKVQALADATGSSLSDDRYTYDAAGNVTHRASLEGDYEYSYDALDRLISATPSAGSALAAETYSYDPVHNRISSEDSAEPWVYNADNELLERGGANGASYGYDANGNTTRATIGDPNAPNLVRTFTYDAAQRLKEVDDQGTAVATYKYDPFGRRIQKSIGGQITWYQYSDEGLIAEYSQIGRLTRAYGWRPDGEWSTYPLWQADVGDTMWNVYYYQNDSIGMPALLVDTTGTVKWHASHSTFGRTFISVSGVNTQARFPGQYADDETGLYYNFKRIYDPSLGRYIQRDPVGIAASINTYGYANQNPLKYFDSTGLASEPGCCDAAADGNLFQNPVTGAEDDGAVICCGGTQVSCANKKHVGDRDPSLAECIKEHEDDHRGHGDSEPCPTCDSQSTGGGGGGSNPPTRPNGSAGYGDGTASECRATAVEVDCLKKHFNSCSGDPVCLSQVRSRANGKIDNMEQVYHCPNLPPKIPFASQ
jgi:RHS repeat-associated protein